MTGLSLAPMSEANTISQAFQVENSLKTPRNVLISNFNRSYSNGFTIKAKEIPCGLSKHMAEPKSNFNLTKIQ